MQLKNTPKIKNKKLFKDAVKDAENIVLISLDMGDDFNSAKDKVFKATGIGNLFAITTAAGLMAVGWRALVLNDVKTLFIREDLHELHS